MLIIDIKHPKTQHKSRHRRFHRPLHKKPVVIDNKINDSKKILPNITPVHLDSVAHRLHIHRMANNNPFIFNIPSYKTNKEIIK